MYPILIILPVVFRHNMDTAVWYLQGHQMLHAPLMSPNAERIEDAVLLTLERVPLVVDRWGTSGNILRRARKRRTIVKCSKYR